MKLATSTTFGLPLNCSVNVHLNVVKSGKICTVELEKRDHMSPSFYSNPHLAGSIGTRCDRQGSHEATEKFQAHEHPIFVSQLFNNLRIAGQKCKLSQGPSQIEMLMKFLSIGRVNRSILL